MASLQLDEVWITFTVNVNYKERECYCPWYYRWFGIGSGTPRWSSWSDESANEENRLVHSWHVKPTISDPSGRASIRSGVSSLVNRAMSFIDQDKVDEWSRKRIEELCE